MWTHSFRGETLFSRISHVHVSSPVAARRFKYIRQCNYSSGATARVMRNTGSYEPATYKADPILSLSLNRPNSLSLSPSQRKCGRSSLSPLLFLPPLLLAPTVSVLSLRSVMFLVSRHARQSTSMDSRCQLVKASRLPLQLELPSI